jgi:Bacterial Ig domain
MFARKELNESCSSALFVGALAAALCVAGCGGTTSSGSPSNNPQDNVPPTVSITAPAAGSTQTGTVNLTATASDNIGVVGVQFLIDGVATGSEQTTAPYRSAWNSASVSNGSHSITAKARDAAGNSTVSSAVTVTVSNTNPVDSTPPTVSVTAPANSSTVSGTVNLTASASDNVGVVGVQFMVDGAATGSEQTSSPYKISWNSASVANGAHSISAKARDAAGNVAVSGAVSVTVSNTSVPDNTPPTVSVTAPSNGATVGATVTLSASASDNVGVVGVQFMVDGTATGPEQTAAPYQVSWNTALVANGSHAITAKARDAAGNSATSSAVTVTVSNSTSPGNNFQARCQSPGVIRCWDFEDANSTAAHLMPPFGSTTLLGQVVNDVVADGSGALRFTVPSQSGADTSGSFSLDFTDDLTQQFGEGQEFYLQVRVRYSDAMISTNFAGSNGFKTLDVGEGDRPGTTVYSCSTLETVLQNIQQNGYPRAYHSCGTYQELQVQIPGTFEYLDQNADGCPHYGNQGFPQTEPPCFKYKANEWITIQEHIKVGHWGQKDSTIEYWAADQGQTSRLIISLADYALINDNPTQAKYGKVWLMPYQTGKDDTQVNPVGYVWYDSLIVSTQRIPDPDVSTPNAPDMLRANPGATTGSIQLTWRDNSGATEQGFRVERCTGEANSCMATPNQFTQVTTVAPNVVSYQDTGLTSGQTYTYRVKAFNSSGDSAYTGGACWAETPTCYSQTTAK